MDEVVTNDKMHYYKVPRLGSYMAIKVEYKSCLFDEAYDAAAEDYLKVHKMRKDQEAEKKAFEEEQARLKKERLEEGEDFTPEVRTWDTFTTQPFKTVKVQYVVCLNTLGQDRQFTSDQKTYALQTAKFFADTWEAVERANLEKDVQFRVDNVDFDENYRQFFDEQDREATEMLVEDAIKIAISELPEEEGAEEEPKLPEHE